MQTSGKSGRYSSLCIDNKIEELAHDINFKMTPMSKGSERVDIVMTVRSKDGNFLRQKK